MKSVQSACFGCQVRWLPDGLVTRNVEDKVEAEIRHFGRQGPKIKKACSLGYSLTTRKAMLDP